MFAQRKYLPNITVFVVNPETLFVKKGIFFGNPQNIREYYTKWENVLCQMEFNF